MTFVPKGRKFAAMIPSRTSFIEAVINGVSSVSSGVLEYAVTHTFFVQFCDSSFVAAWAIATDPPFNSSPSFGVVVGAGVAKNDEMTKKLIAMNRFPIKKALFRGYGHPTTLF